MFVPKFFSPNQFCNLQPDISLFSSSINFFLFFFSVKMDANLMLERQPPIGGVGPPPPRGQGDVFSYHNKYLGAPAVPQDLHRSPRLMITPSSPDNVGPALGRLGRSIGMEFMP